MQKTTWNELILMPLYVIVHATSFPQKRPNVKKSKFDRVASRDICTGMVAISSEPLTRCSRWNQHAQTTKPGDGMHLLTHTKVDLGPFRVEHLTDRLLKYIESWKL